MARTQHEKVTVIGSYASKTTSLYRNLFNYNIPMSTQYEIELYAPENVIAKTNSIRLRWVAYGSGVANKRMGILTNQRAVGLILATAKENELLEYSYGEWLSPATATLPSDKNAQWEAQSNAVFTSTDPLVFQFHNQSSAGSDGGATKEIVVRYEFERVVQQ